MRMPDERSPSPPFCDLHFLFKPYRPIFASVKAALTSGIFGKSTGTLNQLYPPVDTNKTFYRWDQIE